MSNPQFSRTRLIGVTSMIPASLESELRAVCARQHHDIGVDYAETFSEVVRLGLQSIQAKRSAALMSGVEVIRRANHG
ncbi:MAG: hypothetical protein ABL911_03020 [Gallionella sp.]